MLRCPTCGDDYVEGISQCPDCGSALQDERLLKRVEPAPRGPHCPRCHQRVKVPLLALAIPKGGGRFSFDCHACGLRIMPSKGTQRAHAVGMVVTGIGLTLAAEPWWSAPGLRFFPVMLGIIVLSLGAGWLTGYAFLAWRRLCMATVTMSSAWTPNKRFQLTRQRVRYEERASARS